MGIQAIASQVMLMVNFLTEIDVSQKIVDLEFTNFCLDYDISAVYNYEKGLVSSPDNSVKTKASF